MAGQSKIQWKQGDYIKLGRAVADFNKKVNKLQAEENKLYLPNLIEYKEAKENITTRGELNRLVNSLRRFNREGAEELYTTQAGEQMTKWERKELGIQSRIAQTRLKQELKQLNEPTPSGYSRAQMGSQRVKEINAQLKNLKLIESKVGYDKLVKKLETFKNPLSFYEFLSQNELLADITYMYDMGTEGIAGVSDQDKFNYLLESVGIQI